MTSDIVDKTQTAVGQLTGAGAPFEVGSTTLDGVSYKAYKNAPATLVDLFAPAQAHGDKEAVVFGDERWTFAQLPDHCLRLRLAQHRSKPSMSTEDTGNRRRRWVLFR